MKKILFSGSLIFMLSGCATINGTGPVNNIVTPPANTEQRAQTTQTTAPSNPNPASENTCPSGQYSCACATGNYCLRMGAMCLSPSSPCPVQTSTAKTETLQNYKNSAYDFQFDYPATFALTDPNYGNLENKIVQVQLLSGAYPKTNFDDAAFTVSEKTAKSLNECLAMNEPEGGTGFKDTATVNGIKFYTTTGNGAGAGNFYETKIYRTFSSSECLEIVETIHTSNIENFDPGTVTEINKTPIQAELEKILSTFDFTTKTL